MHFKTSGLEKVELGFGNQQCNNRMHFAGLYQSEKERGNIFDFFNQGYNNNNANLYYPNEKFSDKYPENINRLSDPEICRFNTVEELYYPDEEFLPWEIDKKLNTFWNRLKSSITLRASAEMNWAIEKKVDKKLLIAYEPGLNKFINRKSWISICLYNAGHFSVDNILQILQTHIYPIGNGGVITKKSVFYQCR